MKRLAAAAVAAFAGVAAAGQTVVDQRFDRVVVDTP